MDPRTFDGIVQRLAGSRTRRSVLAGSVLAVLGFGEAALAKHHHQGHARGDKQHGVPRNRGIVSAQARLNLNEQCPKKKHGKKLTCEDCPTGFSVPYTNTKGKTVRKCACKPVGEACSAGTAANCCSGVCSEDGQCISPLSPGQACAAEGISCTANVQCCSSRCNVGALDTDTANTCVPCLTSAAACDPNNEDAFCCSSECVDVGADPGVTGQCCSFFGEPCKPLGGTATAPSRGSCCAFSGSFICPVAGGVGTPEVCCRTTGSFVSCDPSGTEDACCTGQCSFSRCCAPAGTNPVHSGGFPCNAAGPNASCCSGNCAAADTCA